MPGVTGRGDGEGQWRRRPRRRCGAGERCADRPDHVHITAEAAAAAATRTTSNSPSAASSSTNFIAAQQHCLINSSRRLWWSTRSSRPGARVCVHGQVGLTFALNDLWSSLAAKISSVNTNTKNKAGKWNINKYTFLSSACVLEKKTNIWILECNFFIYSSLFHQYGSMKEKETKTHHEMR